jgi:outer membrane protein assembly factor BamA
LIAHFFARFKEEVLFASLRTSLICIIFFIPSLVFSQEEDSIDFKERLSTVLQIDSGKLLRVDSVTVTGNKKTKRYIILREILLKNGSLVRADSLVDRVEHSRQLVYNTNLFSDVIIQPRFIDETNIVLDVTVKERWYIYPTPQFQLVDRNYNEWINRYNASLERVVYGVKFAHYNLSGRRDQLRVYVLNGFARNFSVYYTAPYSNRNLTEGFGFGLGFTQSRDVTYGTNKFNRPMRYSTPDKEFVRSNYFAVGNYIARRGYYKRHLFSVGFAYSKVQDSVVEKYNPGFYDNGNKNYIAYPEVGYSFQYLHLDNINYPLKGKAYSAGISKRGLGIEGGINMLSLSAGYNHYWALGKNWYHTVSGYSRLKVPFKQPYVNQYAMGYDEFYLRGLENYVIDGVASGMVKYTLRKKLFGFNIPVPIKNNIVNKIPFQFFAKSFADAGYSYHKFGIDTQLGNRLLYTGGFGLDILTLYDVNASFEYSFNQLGEKGLFLHLKGGF